MFITFPLLPWFSSLTIEPPRWLYHSVFADDSEGGDGDDGGDEWSDDTAFDDSWGEDDPDEGDDESGEDDDKKKDTSAIKQKQKYREKWKAAQDKVQAYEKEIADLKKNDQPAEAEAKQKEAKEYLRNLMKEIQDEETAAEAKAKADAEAAFESELEAVLEESDKLDEEDVRQVAKEYGVTPKVAARIVTDRGPKQKAKPKTPNERRPVTKKAESPDSEQKRPRSLDEVNRIIKSKLSS